MQIREQQGVFGGEEDIFHVIAVFQFRIEINYIVILHRCSPLRRRCCTKVIFFLPDRSFSASDFVVNAEAAT